MSVNCGTTIMAAMKTRPASLGCMLAADGVVALTWEWQAEAALADDRRHEELVLSPHANETAEISISPRALAGAAGARARRLRRRKADWARGRCRSARAAPLPVGCARGLVDEPEAR